MLALSVLVVGALAPLGCSSSNGSGTGATAPIGEIVGPPDNHCSNGDGGLTVQNIGACTVIDPVRVPAPSSTCDVTFNLGRRRRLGRPGRQCLRRRGGPSQRIRADHVRLGRQRRRLQVLRQLDPTPIVEKADTYFTLTAIRLQDMAPATCAGVIPDVSLDPTDGGFSTHGVPAPPNPSPEIAPGVYKVGPIRFDEAGTWTVRFHLFEECSDNLGDSPHGHAAFFVKVP